jgi:hypothetical protein
MNKFMLVAAVAVAALVLSAVSFQLALSGMSGRSDAVTCTTTITSTITITRTVTTTGDGSGGADIVDVAESLGSCGEMERPSLKVVERFPSGDGFTVTLVYRENAPNPCNRHYVVESFFLTSHPPQLHITLGLKATSAVCIQCLGVVETVIKVRTVLPAGTVIVVNGLSVAV